jgi:hypothetical protein
MRFLKLKPRASDTHQKIALLESIDKTKLKNKNEV